MTPQGTDTAHDRHRRYSCDEPLAAAGTRPSSPGSDSDSEHEPAEGLLVGQHASTTDVSTQDNSLAPSLKRRAFLIRTVALLCICSLSIGSHYASYILGPLKSRLAREIGTSHTDFGLLIAAFSLNSTWTPLIGGVLASTLGTTLTSILATGVIFLGQFLLLLGDIYESIPLMVFGLFVFGLGVSPLAVVQETIVVRFFTSHGLGVSMAFGLVAGKVASFVSARSSYPLSERFGPRAPFYVATFLTGFSVAINLFYIACSKWLIEGAGAELEAPDITEEARARAVTNVSEARALETVAAKRRVNVRQITKLGDVFWAYMALNIFCGMMWSPFTHLAANIIQIRYTLTERDAATQASYLLSASLFLYPICGFLVDKFKHRPIVVQLLLASSCITLSAYTWLALPPSWTRIPGPSIGLFALGHGFAPLLLVVIVPKIVPPKYVSTALGAHKSIEQAGSTIFQTLAGLALDTRKRIDPKSAFQNLLNTFLILNILQFLSILALAGLQRRTERASAAQKQRGSAEEPLLVPAGSSSRYTDIYAETRAPAGSPIARSKGEVRRGFAFALLSAVTIALAWVLFLGTAWFKVRRNK